jgi:hypothetical protein
MQVGNILKRALVEWAQRHLTHLKRNVYQMVHLVMDPDSQASNRGGEARRSGVLRLVVTPDVRSNAAVSNARKSGVNQLTGEVTGRDGKPENNCPPMDS